MTVIAAEPESVPLLLDVAEERWVRRRVATIWCLLIFNVLSYAPDPTVLHMPDKLAKVLTQGALALALLLAITVNERLVVRPNPFLVLMSVLCASSFAITIRDEVSLIGSDYRAIRLIIFVLVLWLLTPWWGREDLFLPRLYLTSLLVIIGSVLLGLIVAPHTTMESGRLTGAIWPIPPTQVAHYCADVAGLTAIMWLAGIARTRSSVVIFLVVVGTLLLTHTRTALVGMLIAVLIASLSLVAWRRRVRRIIIGGLVVGLAVSLVAFGPIVNWLSRGENQTEISDLTGRTIVWSEVMQAPRSKAEVLFGFGQSNDSFNGLPIDSSWLSTYEDLGLFGDVLCGLMLVSLLFLAALRPRSPTRAMAIFLIVYCMIASVTETGLGGASTYTIDLTVAASLLATPVPFAPRMLRLRRRPRPALEPTYV